MTGLLFCVGAVTVVGLAIGHLEVILRILRKCGCASLLLTCKTTPVEETEDLSAQQKPFRNMPPPILPLNFKEIPVQACLKEIKVRMIAMEELLQEAQKKAGDAMATFTGGVQ